MRQRRHEGILKQHKPFSETFGSRRFTDAHRPNRPTSRHKALQSPGSSNSCLYSIRTSLKVRLHAFPRRLPEGFLRDDGIEISAAVVHSSEQLRHCKPTRRKSAVFAIGLFLNTPTPDRCLSRWGLAFVVNCTKSAWAKREDSANNDCSCHRSKNEIDQRQENNGGTRDLG